MRAAIVAMLVFGMALAGFLFSSQAVPSPNQGDITVSGSYKDLYYRLDKLEAKITELQGRIKELESRPKFMTVPGNQLPPETQMPPGSVPHDFNGMKFWTIPLKNK